MRTEFDALPRSVHPACDRGLALAEVVDALGGERQNICGEIVAPRVHQLDRCARGRDASRAVGLGRNLDREQFPAKGNKAQYVPLAPGGHRDFGRGLAP